MFEVFLLLIIFLLSILLFVFFKRASRLEQQLQQLSFSKDSQSVKYGKLTEQFAPFINSVPFNAENFRFIGSPIDGIAFEPDSIVFCEFKSAGSKLSPLQKQIKQLVDEKKVEWLEFRLE